MYVNDDGGSVGKLELVTFVEFMTSIESVMMLVAIKIDDDLSDKLATKNRVRSKLNNSMLLRTT